MTEHDRDHPSQNAGGAQTSRRRGRAITGLTGPLPDRLVSPGREPYARNARAEASLTVRSVLDVAIVRQEAGPRPRRDVSTVGSH